MKEQHQSHIRKMGACLHQLLNLGNETLLSTLARQRVFDQQQGLNDDEMCSPTIVITANGEVQTQEEATVCVKELDIFLTVKVFENTPGSIVARKALR